MLAVSTSPIIARYLNNVPAVAISFWRMGFGALILWGISLVKKQDALKNGEAPPPSDLSAITEGGRETEGAYKKTWR